MAIRVQTEFIREGTVRVIYYHYDDDEALADATSVSLSIKNPKGTVVENDTAMDKTSTGTYEYYYETTTSVIEGNYQIEVAALDGSYITHAKGHFKMVAGINE